MFLAVGCELQSVDLGALTVQGFQTARGLGFRRVTRCLDSLWCLDSSQAKTAVPWDRQRLPLALYCVHSATQPPASSGVRPMTDRPSMTLDSASGTDLGPVRPPGPSVHRSHYSRQRSIEAVVLLDDITGTLCLVTAGIYLALDGSQ